LAVGRFGQSAVILGNLRVEFDGLAEMPLRTARVVVLKQKSADLLPFFQKRSFFFFFYICKATPP
jgi:hypothetical protein